MSSGGLGSEFASQVLPVLWRARVKDGCMVYALLTGYLHYKHMASHWP